MKGSKDKESKYEIKKERQQPLCPRLGKTINKRKKTQTKQKILKKTYLLAHLNPSTNQPNPKHIYSIQLNNIFNKNAMSMVSLTAMRK